MRVRAVANTGHALSEQHFHTGWTARSRFDLTLNQEYDVYGICLVGDLLEYLVEDNSKMPQWYPAAAFELSDDRVSQEWHFRIFPPDSAVTAVWGYRELTDEGYFDALADHNFDALRIFREKRIHRD